MADTSVWIDYFNGIDNPNTRKLDELLLTNQVVIGDIILAEILQGFRKDSDFDKAIEALGLLDCYNLAGKEIAVKSAENFSFLRKKGITISKTADLIIGTFCIVNDIPLLYSDRDFAPLRDYLDLKTV